MRITTFAGLTVLEPGEPFSTDGYSFQDRNPELTDRMLHVGAVTHRHDGHPALANPTEAPSATSVASGGGFPAETDAVFGYTLVDAWGGESLISPLGEVTTAGQIQAPDAPTASADYAAGGLLSGIYSYVKTWTDGAGGETDASFEAVVAIDPGHASGRVRFTGLSSGMTAASATGWRLYKSANGSNYHFIAAGSGATLDDAGQLCADCVQAPPGDNTTQSHNLVQVLMPGSLPASAVGFRLYGSIDVGFASPSFFGLYPAASAGATFNFAGFDPGDGSPPPISTTLPGAAKIDYATEVIGGPTGGGGGGGGGMGSFAYGGSAVAIPDGVTSPETGIPIPVTASGAIAQLAVKLEIAHTYAGDVTLRLRHPDGVTIVQLASAYVTMSVTAQAADGFGTPGTTPPDMAFSDTGTADLSAYAGASPIVGVQKPDSPLSAFNGMAASGIWTLLVSDVSSGDTGSVIQAVLDFDPLAPPATGPALLNLRLSTSQSIPSSTATDVIWDAVPVFNTDTAVYALSSGQNRVQILADGYYDATAQVLFEPGSVGDRFSRIRQFYASGGSGILAQTSLSNAGTSFYAGAPAQTGPFQAHAGDELVVDCYHDAPGSLSLNGLAAHRIIGFGVTKL